MTESGRDTFPAIKARESWNERGVE